LFDLRCRSAEISNVNFRIKQQRAHECSIIHNACFTQKLVEPLIYCPIVIINKPFAVRMWAAGDGRRVWPAINTPDMDESCGVIIAVEMK